MHPFTVQILLPIHQGLRGRKTMRYWRDAQENQWKSLGSLQQFQLEAFQRLIRHAEKNCKYYEQVAGMGIECRFTESLEDVQRLPLLQRSEFRKFRAEIRSDIQQGKTYAKSTGGSSGEPLHFELCRDSNDRRVAMTYRGYDWAGRPRCQVDLVVGCLDEKTNCHAAFQARSTPPIRSPAMAELF